MSLNPDQFNIVDQGVSPLRYDRFGGRARRRIALVHPDLPAPPTIVRPTRNIEQVRDIEYWAPKAIVGRGLNNRPLKERKEVVNPSAAAPGTGAFLDFLDISDDRVYVDYVNKRRDLPGIGAAHRLIQHVADIRPNAEIDLGRVMNPKVWQVGERLRESGRRVDMKRDF